MEDSEKLLLEFPSKQGMAITWDENGKQTGGIGARNDVSYLHQFSDQDRYPVLGHFSQEVQNWALFNLLPPRMRESLPVRKELQLQSLGENLPIVLHVLQTEYLQKFKELEGYFTDRDTGAGGDDHGLNSSRPRTNLYPNKRKKSHKIYSGMGDVRWHLATTGVSGYPLLTISSATGLL